VKFSWCYGFLDEAKGVVNLDKRATRIVYEESRERENGEARPTLHDPWAFLGVSDKRAWTSKLLAKKASLWRHREPNAGRISLIAGSRKKK